MRIIKEEEKTVIVKNTEAIICNCCGRIIESEELNLVQDVSIYFNRYGSLYENQKWNFDLCEDCLTKIIKSFKVVPENFMKDPSYTYPSDGNQDLQQELFEEWKETGEWNEEEINYYDYPDEEDCDDEEKYSYKNNVIMLEDYKKE